MFLLGKTETGDDYNPLALKDNVKVGDILVELLTGCTSCELDDSSRAACAPAQIAPADWLIQARCPV